MADERRKKDPCDRHYRLNRADRAAAGPEGGDKIGEQWAVTLRPGDADGVVPTPATGQLRVKVGSHMIEFASYADPDCPEENLEEGVLDD
jgi:hypothetical protein